MKLMRILIIGPNQPRNGSYFHDATYMLKKKSLHDGYVKLFNENHSCGKVKTEVMSNTIIISIPTGTDIKSSRLSYKLFG